MGKLLVIKNADFSANAIELGEWAVGYKALYDKYLALSGLSEQDFLDTYCSRTEIDPFYFIDKEQICSGKTISKMYMIGHTTKDIIVNYGICDGVVNKSISNPKQIGSITISTGPSGILNLRKFQVPLDKYYYWQITIKADWYCLDKTKLKIFNPIDLEKVGIVYTIPGFINFLIPQPDVYLIS